MISYTSAHKSGRTFRERNQTMHPNKRAWIVSAIVAGFVVIVAGCVLLATWRPVVSEARVSGLRLALPEGTQLVAAHQGRHGESRVLYQVPDKGYLETVELSDYYGYSDFYHEVAEANPEMISGNLHSGFYWAGSSAGYGEALSGLSTFGVGGSRYGYVYTYHTASDNGGVLVIRYGEAFPEKWLIRSIELADWEE